MRLAVFIFLLICYLDAEEETKPFASRHKRDIKCARRLSQGNVSTHIWGEICCDAELEEMLLKIEEKEDVSLGDIARALQRRIQALYDRAFEVVISAEDFAVSSYYQGQRMCKIKNNGLYVLAYQTPEKYDLNDTRKEGWLAGIDSQDNLGSTLEIERVLFRDIRTDPLADIDSGTHCDRERRDGNKCCHRLLYTMMTKIVEDVSTSPVYNSSLKTPGVVANVAKRRVQKRFNKVFEVIVSRDDFAMATYSFGDLYCKFFKTDLYILVYATPFQTHFDVENEEYEHGYSIISQEEVLGTNSYMLPGQKISMGIELESDGYRLGYPKDSHCDNDRKGGSKCCHMELFHSMHNSVMDLKSDDSFEAVDRRMVVQQMRKAAEVAINQPLEMIVASKDFHVTSNHDGDCVCKFRADDYHIMAWRVPGNYTIGQDFFADNGRDDFTGCPSENETSVMLEEVRFRRQTMMAEQGGNKCCNRTLKYTIQKNFQMAMGAGEAKLDANELSRKLARMAQMQYGSQVETIVSRGDFQFKSSGQMKQDACKADMGGFNVMMYESGGTPDPNEFLTGDVAVSAGGGGGGGGGGSGGSGSGSGGGDGNGNGAGNSNSGNSNSQANSQSQSQSQSNAQQSQSQSQSQTQNQAQSQPSQAQNQAQQQAIQMTQSQQQTVMSQSVQSMSAPSMPPVPPVPPVFGAGMCFPEDSWVQTPEGPKRMAELQIGDYVLSANIGKPEYSPVTHWLHREPDRFGGYFGLQTAGGKLLHISPKHFMFKTSYLNQTEPIEPPQDGQLFAYLVDVGDCVYAYKENAWTLERIVSKDLLWRRGLFAPLTNNGKIVVNGILASCYTDLDGQVLQYTYFETRDKLHKLFYGLTSWLSRSSVIKAPYLLDLYEDLIAHILPKA